MLFVRLPSLINFRGVLCYKNHAQEANEKSRIFFINCESVRIGNETIFIYLKRN